MYASTGPNQAFVQNPNELVFLDRQSAARDRHAARAHAAQLRRPSARLTFTPTLGLPGGDRRLLIVESEQDISILDLAGSRKTRSPFRSPAATTPGDWLPAAVVVDDGNPASVDDARIGVRLQNDPSVITLTLEPEPGTTGFRPTINLTDVGGVPTDIAFVRTDDGLRLAALVPTRSEAVLVDPVTSLTTMSPCPPATPACRW